MLAGIPQPWKTLIIVAILGVFQVFIISLTSQNQNLFSEFRRSVK